MNQLKVTKNVLVLSVEEKNKSNLYNFLDLETNSVLTALGVKQSVQLHTPLQVRLNVRISSELFELKDGTRKFVNTSSLYIEGFEKVDK